MNDDASGHSQLNYRVGGVCVHDGHVLLQRLETEKIWALPGGRPKIFETARDALVREMREEIETPVEVGRLLWVMENFFAHEGRHFHEIALYFVMALPADSRFRDLQAGARRPRGRGDLVLPRVPGRRSR
jgi:ADP-ribose pyrophosphatase YjhB (NUDIX family)